MQQRLASVISNMFYSGLSTFKYVQRNVLQGYRYFSNPPELPPSDFKPKTYKGPSYEKIKMIRESNLSIGLTAYYKNPVLINQGYKQWLFDQQGKRYLDMIAGIVTVSIGHCHPEVVRAAHEQMQTLWHTTNVYWYPAIHEYAEKLVKKLPGDLKVCYFTNSGSEANDVAMLLARLHTGNFDLISLRNSYHGVSPSTMGLTGNSKWKHSLANGFGIHHAMNPDVYHGIWGGKNCRDSPVQTTKTCDCHPESCAASEKYVQQLEEILLYSVPGKKVAGFFAEPIQGIGGIVQYPKNYLKSAFDLVRKHGGVCIADEVQTGFGRTGDHYWGFESHDVIPDIVTMAKGIANGFPMGAVVTTPEIAQSLNRSLIFNTFGGNALACVIGSTVLDVIDKEKLQENCRNVGTYLINKLKSLRDEFEIVGDVRGKGLMIGLELVNDKISTTPLNPDHFNAIWEHCREMGLLLGKGGFHGNVFRLQPPMCITKQDADFCVQVLHEALSK